MVLPDSPRVSRVRGYSGIPLAGFSFRVRGYHPVFHTFPDVSTSLFQYRCVGPTTPPQKPGVVWALPISLAATHGVSFDFLSYGYLDVSVPRVGSLSSDVFAHAGFPHSDISGSKRACPLPEAFRRLLRPSSPPTAKASSVCPL